MTVLDDLEAALAYTFEKVNLPEKAHIVVRVSDVVQVIAVCRAAVAYRKARRSGDYDAIAETKQALLAATEGL